MFANLISTKTQSRLVCLTKASSIHIFAGMLALSSAGVALAGDREVRRDGVIQPDLLYHNYCSVCHGDRGDGRSRASGSLVPPPRDFTSRAAIAELSRERMIRSVTDGVPHTAMAGWKVQLDGAKIAAIVDYVRNSIMKPQEAVMDGHGRTIYAANCSSCHADDGRGVVHEGDGVHRAAPDLATPEASAQMTRDSMLFSVKFGKSGTLMVDYGNKLSEQDMGAVVDYIRAAFMLPTVTEASGTHAYGANKSTGGQSQFEGATVDMSAPLPENLSGDAGDGHAYYLANCTGCHGEKGDGKGPRAYFINPRPRDFLEADARGRLNRPALFEAISNGRFGSEMPAWSKVLDKKQVADIAEFVFQEFIHPVAAVNAAAGKK